MKILGKLSIGDELYRMEKEPQFLDYKDQYGNVTKNQIYETYVVNRLDAGKDGSLMVNYNSGNYSSGRPLVVFSQESLTVPTLYSKDGHVWFANKEDAHDIARKILLKAMEDRKKIIQSRAIVAANEIKEIREKYFFILNPSLANPASL